VDWDESKRIEVCIKFLPGVYAIVACFGIASLATGKLLLDSQIVTL
jgi:hypothetical protein